MDTGGQIIQFLVMVGEQLINGLTVGGIYALIALGYTMVYGIIKLINFAHGDIFMIGAYSGYFAVILIADIFIGSFLASALNLDAASSGGLKSFILEYRLYIAVIASIVFCGLLGLFVEKVAYRPLREGSPKTIIGSAVGLAVIIMIAVFGNGSISFGIALLFLVILISLSAATIAYLKYMFNNFKGFKKGNITQKHIIYTILYITAFIILAYLAWYYDINNIMFLSFMVMLLVYWLVVSRVKSSNMGGNSRINALISAIGMSMILTNLVALLKGNSAIRYDMGFSSGILTIGSFHISYLRIFIILFSFVLMGVLFYIIHKTKFGLAMRAVSHNLNAAKLMGINPDKVIGNTFIIGSALAGVAGVLVGTSYGQVDPNIGIMYGLKAFVAAVLGGIGSIPGAVVGGIILGVVETFGTASPILSSYRDAIAFGILILILIIKPTGIFGKPMKEKV